MMNRRSLITGLISLVAAPAIVRVASIMPVKQMLTLDDTLWTTEDVVWTASSSENMSAGFWIRGYEYQLGDTFKLLGCVFRVNSVESVPNSNGKLWQHVIGESA